MDTSKRSHRRAAPGAFLALLFLSACSLATEGTAPFERDRTAAPPAAEGVVPREETKSRWGNAPSYVVFGRRYRVMESSTGYVEKGVASWYGEPFHGRQTANGETYDMHDLSAAHRSLPLPTYVQVTNLDNGRRIVVRINDRGPFYDDRIIDLSYAAARRLDMVGPGTARVEVRALEPAAADRPQ